MQTDLSLRVGTMLLLRRLWPAVLLRASIRDTRLSSVLRVTTHAAGSAVSKYVPKLL